MTDHGADLVIRAGAVHTLVPGRAAQRALAVRGDHIAAVSADPNGLDDRVSSRTTVRDLPGEEHLRGGLAPGRLADLTVWDRDPAHCPADILRDLHPVETVVGGRVVAGAGPR
ncbi:amidohydrolase family protein [Streptomyces sp. NPDC001793]|uniref:amidohydrolase family protein n=1 Tax=Streptomyces sp. NPDC001793 TaxID=3154657 RepID=UPI00332BB9E7